MSDLSEYIRSGIQDYVDRKIDRDAFLQVFGGAYFHARNLRHRDREADELANRVIRPVAEYSGGHISEVALRQELEAAIRPFEKGAIPYVRSHRQRSHNSASVIWRNTGRPDRMPASSAYGSFSSAAAQGR